MSRQLDVLFINPNSSAKVYQELSGNFTAIEVPTWSLLLAQSCRKNGYGAAILDCDAERLTDAEAVVRITEINPRLVVFCVFGQNPNSGTTNMTGAISLCKFLKECTNYKTCFVGSHTSALPKEVLAYSCVDFVLLNEGVYALRGLLMTDLENDLQMVKGIGWKEDGKMVLNTPQNVVPLEKMDIDLPGSAWDLLPYKNKPLDMYRSHFWHAGFDYNKRTPAAALYTSLGCQFKCLRGDTVVNTIYGDKSIKELYDSGIETIPVYTYNLDTKEVCLADAKNITKTGIKQKLVRVEFDDGTHIDCTPDHKFLSFIQGNQAQKTEELVIEAQHLKPKMGVRAFKKTINAGYNIISWGRKKAKRNCRMVMEYKLKRKLSRRECVHHIDHNKANDNPENLLYCATAKDHYSNHPEIKTRMKNNNPSKYCTEESRIKLSKALTGKKRTLEQRLNYRESKLGEKNPNFVSGDTCGQPSRIKEINHRVVRVYELEDTDDVYCLEVPDYGWFFANNVLVKNCSFCMINTINRDTNDDNYISSDTNKMRFWSPEFIIKEFDKLVEMGVSQIRISDEMFVLNRKYYEPLLKLIVERGYGDKLQMWCYSRVDSVNPRFLDLFRQAGIKWFALGVESGSQNVRQEVTKGSFKEINIRDVVKQIRDHGINVIANYIYGLDTDTHETMQQTLDLAIELNTEMYNGYPAQALPGSYLHRLAKQKGWELPNSFEGYSFHSYECQPMRTEQLTAAEILKFRDEAWQKYMTGEKYLNLIENKFGIEAKNNILEMAKIKLKRKLLGD